MHVTAKSSNTYRFAAGEITDQELHPTIDSPQNDIACFNEIYIADNSETKLLPGFRPKQVCGRICAYTRPQGVKAISVSHRNARLG